MTLDELQQDQAQQRLTLAVFTPHLQGFYLGELVNQIRQLCLQKGHQLVLICTDGFGEYSSDLHLAGLDAAIIIRNAVAPALAENLRGLQIPCVAIAYDYFPQPIPLVSSDNEQGVRLAFQHLLAANRQSIAFVGDLSHYDLRKRYEAYCQLSEENALPVREDYLFTVSNTLFAGGQAAAKEFMQRQCDADAIIFGAGLTGMGFVQYMNSVHPSRARDLSYLCFDSNPLIPVFSPEMHCLDQNFDQLAGRSLAVIEALMRGEPVAPQTLVQPKLVGSAPAGSEGLDNSLATCVDLPELQNPHYMKALLANLHDWPREIGASQLEQLMSIAPLFPRLLDSAFLSRYYVDEKQRTWVKHTKTLDMQGGCSMDANDADSLCRARDFPPASIRQQCGPAYDICTHLPIHLNGRLWGFLSLMGGGAGTAAPSSYFGFAGYMEAVVQLYEQELTLMQLKKALAAPARQDKHSAATKVDPEASIHWSATTGITLWAEKSLALLGFTTPIERNIYQNLDITDRLHVSDVEAVQQAMDDCCKNGSNIRLFVRLKSKNGDYLPVLMTGKAIREDHQRPGINFCIGLQASE